MSMPCSLRIGCGIIDGRATIAVVFFSLALPGAHAMSHARSLRLLNWRPVNGDLRFVKINVMIEIVSAKGREQ